MQLKKALDATFIMRREGNRRLLVIEPAAPSWSGLEIDLDTLTVKTPFGLLNQHYTVDHRTDVRLNNRFIGTERMLEERAASMRIYTDNALYGCTLNPRDPAVTPGGSGGGKALLPQKDAYVRCRNGSQRQWLISMHETVRLQRGELRQ